MARVFRLSKCSGNPGGTYNAMRRAMLTTIKLLKSEYVVDLLRELVNKGIPLREVKRKCEKVCHGLPTKRAHDLTKTVMSWKLIDAKSALCREKRENTRVWRECEKTLKENKIDTEFFEVWEEEKQWVREVLRTKRHKKVSFLGEKYGRGGERRREVCDNIEGVTIKDQELSDTFESEPRMYGDTSEILSGSEVDALRLNPKFTVFPAVDLENCEIEIEKGLTKLRWTESREENNSKKSRTKSGREMDQDQDDRDDEPTESQERVWAYNIDDNTMDMRNLRPTDLPFNRNVFLPKPLEADKETEMMELKRKLIDTTKEYIDQNKKKKIPTYPNLTTKEKEGLERLNQREEVVVFETDKSGRFAADSKENYSRASEPHIVNDTTITEEEHVKCQKEINAHAIMWTRILKAGEKAGNTAESRVKRNITVAAGSHGLAPLYTLRKDHKVYEDKEIGPPVRPVCGGSAAYNNKFSHLISSLLKHVWKDCDTACENTEEILAEIRDHNQHGIEGDAVIGSLDVKALYPNLDVGFTAEIVAKEFRESQFEVEGIDYKELGLYLAMNKTEQELENLGLLKFCPRRKTRFGRPPVITGKATTANRDEERYKPWKPPAKEPNKIVKKTMVSEALRVAIEYIMKNHIYRFNDTIKKQSQGGPIGLELTGELAAVFMMWWDRELLRRVHMLGLEVVLYKRYVDDINLAVKTPREKKKLTKSGDGDCKLETDHNPQETEDDELYIGIVRDVGNGIHPSIQLEMDCPSLHDDQKLPLLDIKVWIEKEQPGRENEESCNGGEGGKRGQSRIMHEYYYKEVATRAVVDARSAMPWKDKRTVITQEILRILLRCSPDLPWSTTTLHVNEYMKRLQFSHYDERFREEVWRSALNAYNSIKEKDRSGEQPLYRPKHWQRTDRKKKKRAKKEDWYKKGGNKTVIFVPPTPHSQLRKRYQDVIKKTSLKIKVMERSGKTVKSILQKSDPYKQPRCNPEEDCMVCRGGRGNCRREGVTYEIRCSGCNCVYVGETARTGHYRGLQHTTALAKRDHDSVLWRHTVQTHSNSDPPPQYSMVITGYQETALERQITEAVKINNTPPELRLNTREEWGHTRLVRTSLTNL